MESKLIKISLSIFLIAILASNHSYGQGIQPFQDPKYGKDSAERLECLKNISLYSEFYKQNNFKDAVKPWRMVFNSCPKASKNTYIKGANIYKNLIAVAKDEAKKSKLIDTLMMIYDQRIQYYGQEGIVLAYKGSDLYSFRGKEAAGDVYTMLKKSIELEGKETNSAIISVFMQATVDQFKSEQLSADQVIEAYTLSTETIDAISTYSNALINSGKPNNVDDGKRELEIIPTVIGNVEALFSESGAATCPSLVAIYGPAFDQNKNDLEWLKKVTKILEKTGCVEELVFQKAAERQFELDPSAEAAHNLAVLFLKKNDMNKASEYYDKATSLMQDPIIKAQYYYEWSSIALAQENYPKVRELCNMALKLNPNDGKPYLMIGRAYASDAKNIGKENVEHNAVYWVAVDKFIQAKKTDSTVIDQANELINTYTKYFPNKEEAFFIGIEAGKSYTVGGWINESTTARFN